MAASSFGASGDANLQFRNAGFCELIVAGDAPRQEYRLVAFNAIPHLDTPERRAAITFA